MNKDVSDQLIYDQRLPKPVASMPKLVTVNVCVVSTGGCKTILFTIVFCMCYSIDYLYIAL